MLPASTVVRHVLQPTTTPGCLPTNMSVFFSHPASILTGIYVWRTVMIKSVKGTSDIASPEVLLWQHVERTMATTAEAYGYEEIRTPTIETVSYTHLTLPTIYSV